VYFACELLTYQYSIVDFILILFVVLAFDQFISRTFANYSISSLMKYALKNLLVYGPVFIKPEIKTKLSETTPWSDCYNFASKELAP